MTSRLRNQSGHQQLLTGSHCSV